MAFVYEVERPPLFQINKDTYEIGPGQYLPLSLYKFEKPNIVPFGVSTERKFPFSLNPVPGPGSYNPKEEQNISNPKLIKKQELKFNTNKSKDTKLINGKQFKIIKKKNTESEKYQNKENLGFYTKVERFKLKYQKGTPGPGTYDDKNILLAKSIEEQCNNKKEMIFKINSNRHDIFYVNRNNNQFPWNAEVINDKKHKNYETKLNKNETFMINNIINNNKKINKNQKKQTNKVMKHNNNNKLNLTDTDFNEKNKIKNIENYDNKNTKLIKSRTSSNFYLPDTGININDSKLTKKDIKKRLEQEMNERKIQNDIKYRISSIPSKFSTGYQIEKKSGKVVRNPIKTYFKIFSGEKNDAVGPGSYEINLPELWRKTGTCWSKYLCEKEPLKKRPKSGNDLNINYLINHNKLDKNYIKLVKKIINKKNDDKNNINIHNIFKLYSSQKNHIAFNSNILSDEIRKDKLPIFIQVNDVPGPGYYYDEEKNINLNKNNKNSFANIKKINRFEGNFIKTNLDDKEGLGPGTYFHDILNLYNNPDHNNNKKNLSKQQTKSAPFLCKSKRFIYDKPLDFNEQNNKKDSKNINKNNDFKKIIYNNSIQSSQTSNTTHKGGLIKRDSSLFEITDNQKEIKTKTKNFKSLSGTFYRKDIRFRESIQEENMKKEIPGPGSYINPYTSTGKSNSVKFDDRYMDIRSCRIIIEKNRLNKFNKNKKKGNNLIYWLGETNEIKPCVGTYEPDKTMSIQYDVNKNKKYGNNSFNSTQYSNRNDFYLYQKNNPIGPGCYYKDNYIENKQSSAAFYSTSNRFYKGGKNNTRELYRVPKRSLSVLVKKNKNNEDGNLSNELTVRLKENIIKEKENDSLGVLNNSNTPIIVGPGSYNYLPEVYPWIKHTYNVKFV